MKTVLLIRHPETAMAGRFCGHSDPDLNLAGERQMAAIVDRVGSRRVERILSSDLRRASCAAQAISRRIGVAVEIRPGLREIGFGLWEGLTWSEIEARYPQEAALWLRYSPLQAAPGGEPYEAFSARIRAEFDPLLAKSEDRVAAIVTHRGVIDFALTAFFQVPKEVAWTKTAPYGAALVLTFSPASISQSAGNEPAGNYSYTLEDL